MGFNPYDVIALAGKLGKLAKPVLELIAEAIDAVSESKTKRDAARKLSTLAAKRILLG